MSSERDHPQCRFVVLRHFIDAGDHYDLMFEDGRTLTTWRSPVPLHAVGDQPVPVERIADHRLAYLEYEGPISGNRGRVQRIEAGTYRVLHRTDQEWRLLVSGPLTSAALRIRHSAGQEWNLDLLNPQALGIP